MKEVLPTHGPCSSFTTASKLGSLFAIFDLLAMIVSDNGPAFTKAEFKEFAEKNSMRLLTTAPHHATSKGLAECTVKWDLLNQTCGDINHRLSRFLVSYRSTSNEPKGNSPAQIIFKRPTKTRFNMLKPGLHNRIQVKHHHMKKRDDAHTRHKLFEENDPFHTRLPYKSRWQQATVSECQGQVVELTIPDGR